MSEENKRAAQFEAGPKHSQHVEALWVAYKKLIENEISFAGNCGDDERPWLDLTEYRPMEHELVDVVRQVLLRAEIHHTLSCFYVDEVMGRKLMRVGDYEHDRKGKKPERSASADFTTMVTNYELYGFALADRLAGLKKHHSAQQISVRFYFTRNRANPFLKFEAEVMQQLKLWHYEDAGNEFKFGPGPMLPDFIRLLEDTVKRAMKEIQARLKQMKEVETLQAAGHQVAILEKMKEVQATLKEGFGLVGKRAHGELLGVKASYPEDRKTA